MASIQQPAHVQPAGTVRPFNSVELRNYFLPPPGRRIFTLILLNLCILILAIPLIVINTSSVTTALQPLLTTIVLLVLAAPLLYGCFRLLVYYLRARPTDQEYDSWIEHWRPMIEHNGLRELGLDPSEILGQALFVPGLVWPETPEAEFYRNEGYPVLKYDRYGRPRSSVNRFIFFYPTQHDVAIFTCDINVLHPRHYSRAQRYFYNDIVGIEMVGLHLQMDTPSTTLRRFELHVANGQDVGMPVFVDDPTVSHTFGSLNALLRDKKHGPGRGPAGI